MSRSTTILLGLALGLSLALPVDARPATASSPEAASWEPASCPVDGTRRTDLPDDHASLAASVAALRGRAAWIVGMHAGQGIPRRAWIMRRTAAGWREVQAAPTGPDGGLMAVDALRSDVAWAVGFHTTSRFLRPVSQRWDGHSWRAVGVPTSARSEALVDVAIADASTAWTVGFRTTGRGPAPTAFRTRAGRWERHDPDLPAGTFGSLVAVDIAPDGTPWAAGWQSDGTAPGPLVVRFSGGRWVRVATPSASVETILTDLVADGGHVRVLGYTQTGTEQRALLWERDGGGWAADPALPDIAGALPTGLAQDAAGRPLIAGAWRGARGRGHAAMVGARVDGAWRISRAPDGLDGPSQLRSVAWADRGALAVGWTGGQGVATSLCDPWSVDEALSAAPTRGLVAHDGPVRPTAGRDARGRRGRGGTHREPLDGAAANGVRFVDAAATAGLPGPTQSYGATILDLDGDGWDDVLLSRHTERGRVLRNRRGRFVAAAADPLPGFDRHGCAAADVDRDGHADAYCAVGAARGAKLKNNELWTGLSTTDPRQVSTEMGVDDPLGRGRRATFVDLDGDPYPDLVVTSDPLRVDGLPSLTRAWRNDGGRRFVAADDLGLGLPVGGSCVLSADLDGDGSQEIVICTEEAWGSGPGVHILRRSGGRFRDVTAAMGIRPSNAIDAAAADLDGDRRSDLVQLSGGRLTISLQRGGRLVRVASFGATAGTAIGIGDADGDGDADLYVVQGGMGRNAADRLLLNRGDGRAFRAVAIPQARGGTADDVAVLDHDHNGTDDFLVTNGAQGAGPVQLIAGRR